MQVSSVPLLFTVIGVHADPPTVTAVAPLKSLPVIVIVVPPANGPDVGLMDEMVGGLGGLTALHASLSRFAISLEDDVESLTSV